MPMYKIGEFSKITQLTVKTLRYYDEISLLQPAMIDSENSYRYYDEANYEKALKIKTLKKFDFSLKEILEVVDNIEDPQDMTAYLNEKALQLELRMKELKWMKTKIEREVLELKEEKIMKEAQKIEIKDLEDILVASVRYKGKYEDVGQYIGQLFKNVGMNASGTPFSLYYDEAYTEENADVEVCVAIKKSVNKGGVSTRTLQGEKVVSLVHVGSYETLSKSYKRITDYIHENNLISNTPSREIYLKGPGMLMKGNPDKYQTEIQIPVK
jgi:effector-binding domain-containing protein